MYINRRDRQLEVISSTVMMFPWFQSGQQGIEYGNTFRRDCFKCQTYYLSEEQLNGLNSDPSSTPNPYNGCQSCYLWAWPAPIQIVGSTPIVEKKKKIENNYKQFALSTASANLTSDNFIPSTCGSQYCTVNEGTWSSEEKCSVAKQTYCHQSVLLVAPQVWGIPHWHEPQSPEWGKF